MNWKKLWKAISFYTVSALLILITFAEFVSFLKNGFSFSSTFEHVTPLNLFVFVIVLCICLIIFSFIISYLFRFAAITVDGKYIKGRNYWGVKTKFALIDLISLYRYSNNGINAVVAESKSHDKIYISEYTERLDNLLEYLYKYIPDEQ